MVTRLISYRTLRRHVDDNEYSSTGVCFAWEEKSARSMGMCPENQVRCGKSGVIMKLITFG